MPKKLVDESGEEVEALTPEELENEVAAAVTKKEQEIKAQFESQIKTLNEDLGKLKEKDLNFTNLREAKEKLEKEYEDFKAGVTKAESERQAKELSDYKEQLFSTLAGKDEEIKKKIEFEFNKFGNANTTNKEEIEKLANDALKLAGVEPGSVLNRNVISSGGGTPIKPGEIPAHLIPHAKAMGMTEEEFVKFYGEAKKQGLIKE